MKLLHKEYILELLDGFLYSEGLYILSNSAKAPTDLYLRVPSPANTEFQEAR